MTRSRLTRITASAFAAGVASITLAAPAQAMLAHDPTGGGPAVTTTTDSSSGWSTTELVAGALGGVAIAGAGVAAAAGVRRRNAHAHQHA